MARAREIGWHARLHVAGPHLLEHVEMLRSMQGEIKRIARARFVLVPDGEAPLPAALKGARQISIAIAAALIVAFTPFGIAGTLLLAGCVGVTLYHSRVFGLRAALAVTILIGAYHWAGATLTPATAASHVTGNSAPGLWDKARSRARNMA